MQTHRTETPVSITILVLPFEEKFINAIVVQKYMDQYTGKWKNATILANFQGPQMDADKAEAWGKGCIEAARIARQLDLEVKNK
jgi:hypothetical protein